MMKLVIKDQNKHEMYSFLQYLKSVEEDMIDDGDEFNTFEANKRLKTLRLAINELEQNLYIKCPYVPRDITLIFDMNRDYYDMMVELFTSAITASASSSI